MSDIAIPGFSSDSNSAKMIENLLKAKRIPLEKLESTQEEYTNIKGVWQDLRVTFSKLSDSTSKLFGFENPFNEKTVSSTNEEILTAESERSAIDENLSFNIKKLASTDKFVSKQIDENFRIPEGTYKFIISEDEITLKYRGGTAEDFVEKLNKRNPDNLRAS
ncbi:MAG: flagellar hook protein FliD, partial [Candidatus Delongbacteria bacterium]|nr:flagellar hook protein FliD [Candidatus Delongbacteria bacterium]